MSYAAHILLTAVAGGLCALYWLLFSFRLSRAAARIANLSDNSPIAQTGAVPRVSVIIAAKDEAGNIEACARSVLSQDLPDLELVVVNDRSTDATPQILERLRAAHPGQLRVLDIESVPAGWGGQNHAIHQGSARSTGEWLCFTDADCRLVSPRTLAVSLHAAQTRNLAVLSMLPRLDMRRAWEKIYLPIASLQLLSRLRIEAVNDAGDPAAYANGAFMLVRRDAYLALGGHEAVRGELNDDIALARRAKQCGYRIGVVGNENLLLTKMYADLAGAWRGWVRNYLGALRSRRGLAAAGGQAFGLFVLPWVGLGAAFLQFAGGGDPAWPGLGAWGMAVGLSHVVLWRAYRSFESSPGWSLVYFPGALFVMGSLIAANLRAWRRNGILWHDIRYAPERGAGPAPQAKNSNSS